MVDGWQGGGHGFGMDSSSKNVQLVRQVEAVQIPQGNVEVLEKGSVVVITQSLGGSFTVAIPERGGLFRIAGADADALGLAVEKVDGGDATGTFSEDLVWAALKTCYDPEIPVNIVDLGLVYSLDPEQLASKRWRVNVQMTLTAPGCGMGPAIAADARQKILKVPGVEEAEVHVVWEPAWNPSMISADGKKKLGIE